MYYRLETGGLQRAVNLSKESGKADATNFG